MAYSSLLSLAPKPYAAPQTPRNGGPRRLSSVGATAVSLPSRSPGLSRGRLSLGRSTLPTTLRVSVVGNGAAVSVVLVGKTPYNKFGYLISFLKFALNLFLNFNFCNNNKLPQVANVVEMEVVTPDGMRRLCSPSSNSDLFFAVLGGLGQFGIITRARLPLLAAPKMVNLCLLCFVRRRRGELIIFEKVRWRRVVYTDFEIFAGDAESLVTQADSSTLDYVEGFVFVNDVSDPVSGWNSVPILPDSAFDPSEFLADSSGPVLYCLELALYYDDRAADHVDEREEETLRRLRYMKGAEFSADVGYVEFLSRVAKVEAKARAGGTWETPHPWLNLFISAGDIVDFDRHVFQCILRRGIGGPMLVYPMRRSGWDDRMSVALPRSEVFYLVALLRFIAPGPGEAGEAAKAAEEQNRQILRHCRSKGYDFKVYIPRYDNEADWAAHFGGGWGSFVQRKRRYDPMAVLAPGQNIFSRARPPALAVAPATESIAPPPATVDDRDD
ncbi:hypothetical protein ZIOFF_019263 [Zingiber officinale]|uniref:Cytokinin dehydrogenase 1 FAD/cytokinin binding domain-containing protein n=1 Tax=Zingiber officinale TaxID=94328 RepID=A0A8J5HXN6_ZINOF|nr:hypothetical protein ZIOFF_019263 [Zingiber officinale]